MSDRTSSKKHSIQSSLKQLSQKEGHKQRLGVFSPMAGYPLLLLFGLFLLPLYLYMLFFNRVYFWVRGQVPIRRDRYLQYDRHEIAHLTFVDKIWCEYCEWANGSLQWTLKITNEIEKRYCPIKNKCAPHHEDEDAKAWRTDFLDHDHPAKELVAYYEDQYVRKTPER